jgi:putative RecB family exonuclease
MNFNASDVFNDEFDAAIAAEVASSGFPVERWLPNGREKPETAAGQWRTRGPLLVGNFIRWFEQSGQEVWVTPDGRPAIELELRVMFGEVEVHGFADLITVGQYGLTVIDTKSGSRKPDSLQQLGIYASMIELAYGKDWRPLWGAYFLARGTGPKDTPPEELTYLQPPVPLSEYRYSAEFFTRELALFDQAAASGIFVAKPGPDCRVCPVSYACQAVGGSESYRYDPSDPEYGPTTLHG